MSKVLIIRHLPQSLSFQEKQHLLKHFGAEKVWETANKRNYIFASFPNVETAKASLIRLHQLEIAKRRLVVEYSFDNETNTDNNDSKITSIATNHIKEFLRALNAWNPSVNFYQPPPAHLKYKYPEITKQIAININHALFSNKQFYTQTVHLMNKMSLDLPFGENKESLKCFKENFKEFFGYETPIISKEFSDIESEISSEEVEVPKQHAPSVAKRKHILPKTRKRAAAVLSTAILPRAKKLHVKQDEVFENVTPIAEAKKISVNVPQDVLQKQPEGPEIIGELGKFEKEVQAAKDEKLSEPEQPSITKKELLKNRISYTDMKILPVFKNYHPGQPSMRLYIKNLAKTVTEQDVKRIYKRYIEKLSEDEEIGFDVRVMQEGRMKGQAFVTFPSVHLAERALHETNGYMLKERPMVVQFARAANKKTIE